MYYTEGPVPPAPRKRRVIWPFALGAGVLGLLILAALCAGVLGAFGTDDPPPIVQTPHALASAPYQGVSPAPPKAVTQQFFTEGTYEVGSKSSPEDGTIKPGTYVLGTTDHCYWARLKDFDGDLDSILANGNLDTNGADTAQGRITVKKSDKGLELTGTCVLGQKGGLK
jgi:hypothetical protein